MFKDCPEAFVNKILINESNLFELFKNKNDYKTKIALQVCYLALPPKL
jgi:hypothetical protein